MKGINKLMKLLWCLKEKKKITEKHMSLQKYSKTISKPFDPFKMIVYDNAILIIFGKFDLKNQG